MTREEEVAGLNALNDFIHGRKRFHHLGGGITTYPQGDDRQKKLHAGCEELERIGEIERRNVGEDYVVWKPSPPLSTERIKEIFDEMRNREDLK